MTRLSGWGQVITLVLLLPGCDKRGSGSPPEEAGLMDWRLSDLVMLEIGVAEGEESYELAGASSSLRLGDGRILVANSGTSELRVFDSLGHFIKAIGRKGEGPGEFSGSLRMIAVSDSEFAVFDQSAQRLSIFDTAGSLIRESRVLPEESSDFPLWVWLHRNTWVSGPVDTSRRASVGQALDGLPPLPAGSYLYVTIATDGRIWIQNRSPTAGPPQPWVILSSTGAPLGRILLPEGTEVHQIGSDFVLLRHWGKNDVEQIQLYRFEERRVPNMASSAPLPDYSDTTGNRGVRMMMATAMRSLVMAQEMFYMDNAAYATNADSLKWEAPEGTSLHLMAADKRGWVGLIVHRTQPILCGMAVGGSTPPGWMEGSPKCSR